MSATKPKGVTGVAAPSGYLQQREQNPNLQWPFDVGTAVEPGAYERMARTDPVVASCVMAVVLPIAQAEWDICEPDAPPKLKGAVDGEADDEADENPDVEEPDESEDDVPEPTDDTEKDPGTDAPDAAEDMADGEDAPEEAEDADLEEGEEAVDPITAFVRQAFFEDLKPGLKKTVADLVRSASVNGHHVVEPIYRLLDDGPFAGKVTLRTLAPRPAWTIERFNLDEAGELVSVVQGAPQPDGKWTRAELTVDEILVFTHDQQGGDPRGQSVLRPIYLTHKVKELLLKLIGVRNEREALGMPIVEEPQGGLNAADRARLDATLKGWRAHEQAYLRVPFGCKVTVPEGKSGAATAVRDDFGALNLEIRTAFLQHFQQLGSTETGARSVGEIQAAVFYLALVGIAELVVDQLNLLIERLVDLNFGPQERYPYFEAPKIRAEDVTEALNPIATALEKGLITHDDSVEKRARDALGLPQVKKKKLHPAMQAVADAAAAGQLAPPPPPQPMAPAAPGAAAAIAEAAKTAMQDRPRRGKASRQGELRLGSFSPRRMLTPAEKRVAFGEIAARFDNAVPELQQVVGNAIRGNRGELVAWVRPLVRRIVGGDDSALQDLERKDLPRAVRAELVQSVQRYADEMHAFGRHQAQRERKLAPAVAQREARKAAQAVREDIPTAEGAPDTTGGLPLAPFPPLLTMQDQATAPVRTEAAIQGDRIADELLRLLRLTVARAAARQPKALARHPDPESREPYAAVNYVLDELQDVISASSESMATVRDSALGISVRAFSGGREEVFGEHADEIESVSYSSVMDGLQCQVCEGWDEKTAASLDDADAGRIPPTPNPSCLGTAERCRCIWVVNYR